MIATRRPSKTRLTFLAFALTLAAIPGSAEPLDGNDRATIIDGICAALDTTYVFPETATKMCASLNTNLTAGAYDELTDLSSFCGQLTEDLRAISSDRHLGVAPAPPPADPNDPTPSEEEELAREIEALRKTNFCFERVEVLPENTGYVKLDCFAPAEYAGPTVTAAMNFVANADALIFDVRDNSGGDSSTIQLISSYLFDESVHLNDFYIRENDETKQFWTQAHIDGERLAHLPVWVLTSRRTFSAGEGFAYQLKHLERATVIGETTAGGAHPTRTHEIEGTSVVMRLPYGRAINPVTGTNWEGTGVEPHIQVPRDQALERARTEAISALLDTTEDAGDRWRLEWVRDGLEIAEHPVDLGPKVLAEYVGAYGPRMITLTESGLRYQRGEGPVLELVPMGDDRFFFPALDYFRVRFERDTSNRVVRIVGMYEDGETDTFERHP